MSFLFCTTNTTLDDRSRNTNRTVVKLSSTYPSAAPIPVLVNQVVLILRKQGFADSTTLFTSSVCCDEANRCLEEEFGKIYGKHFCMGGLAGFPFGGTTSFKAMAHHIPDGGSCLIVYGPHVGFDSSGEVGKLSRRGKAESDACCGSACAALAYVQSVTNGQSSKTPVPSDHIDIQQWIVGNSLLEHGKRLQEAKNPMAELPKALFDLQMDTIHKIVKQCSGAVHDGKIALLGGIQVNTPSGLSDYFVPMRFEIFSNRGKLIKDLTSELW